MTSTPTIAFLGATGGVTNACLVHCLKNGYNCIALVRNPKKLQDQLSSQGLSSSDLSHLTTVKGNALDTSAVQSTLSVSPTHLVSTIISGLGAAPQLRFSFNFFTIDQPSLCGDASRVLVNALKQIYVEHPNLQANKPLLAFISTTGISRGPNDVPWYLGFLYHYLLKVPHKDKRVMEATFRDNVDGRNQEARVFEGYVGVRPTLLTGEARYTDAVGLAKLRVGTEEVPAKGFTVKRADVGHWVFENVVRSEKGRGYWKGKMASLTA